MADEIQDKVQQEEFLESEAEAEAEAETELGDRKAERQRGALRRLWDRFTFVLAWLRRPDEVGQPITLRPRGVRLLILLVLGNLFVLVLLTGGLYRASTMLTVVESPLSLPTAAIATFDPELTSGPSPTLGPTPTPFGSGGAIAFTLRRNGNADIYALNQTDRQLVRLTYNPAEDRDPAWSPDGNYIAFASNRAHNWDIYLLDLVSGALIRLTNDPGFDANPSWSSDGRWIAFESYRRGNLDIYVMSTTGQEVRRITSDSTPDYEPAWSPDSRAIAFSSFRDGNKDIYLCLLDGEGEIINVTQSPDLDEDDPAWSPDGTQLAYVSGPHGSPSIQVTTFDWDEMTADQTQTELLGTGGSPAWAPDGQSLIYAYERGTYSHLIAASMTGWALFHEVYSTNGLLDDLTWTSLSLSHRIVARAQAAEPSEEPPFYVELVQPSPATGPPYTLIPLPNVDSGGGEFLSDRVNESFNALRQRVAEETGLDYLATLNTASLPMTYTPPSGHSRMTWYVCGRAIGLDRESYEGDDSSVELIREDVGNVTYWRVFIRAAKQDGSMGEPLREAVWDLNARQRGGRAAVEGGALQEHIPDGYYVDFTTLASDYGWERVPALWRWRYFWPDTRWWRFRKTDGMNWWECMVEVFEPKEIEAAFGPIPEYED